MASMLHASQINPFDSQEARPYRDDPEIVAMTNLVRAFHNNEIHSFERILRQNQGRIMDDEFMREHIEDLLRTMRIQVLRRFVRPYQRISLSAIATALNDIPIAEIENLLINLILDGKLDGLINRTEGVLVKRIEYGGGDSSAAGNVGLTKGVTTTSSAANTGTATNTVSSSSTSTTSATTASGKAVPYDSMKSPTVLKCEAMAQMEDISRQNTTSITMNLQ
jgi:PCI domain